MITAIDKQTALVLIDLQKGIAYREAAHPTAGVIANAAKLVAAFREKGLPVVIVNVNPIGSAASKARTEKAMIPRDDAGQEKALEAMLAADFFTIVPEVELRPGEDILITKNSWNAFAGTALHIELQLRNITGIVLCGISTSIGVESTARTANEHGYNISFATDATTDSVMSAYENSIKIIFPRIGEVGTTEEIIRLLPQ